MRVVVIGAGIAGLSAARPIADAGHTVVILDKGRRTGGRLATTDLDNGARADHGAQFFTVRGEHFADAVAHWSADGAVWEWCRGFTGDDGHPRYCAPGGMARLAERIATGLDVRCSIRVESVRPSGERCSVSWDAAHGHAAEELEADFVILTPPVMQSAELLGAEATVPRVSYEPVLALMLALDGPPSISAPGAVQLVEDPTWSWVADNVAKGTSTRPAVTLHTTPKFATARWDTDRASLIAELLDAAAPWLGRAAILQSVLHRWRYATARELHPEPCLSTGGGRVVLAGDAFASPRIEGAFLSGLAAAARVLES